MSQLNLVSRTIRKKSIDELPEKDQLAFYRYQFIYSHCEKCSNELTGEWVLYEGNRYCERCYDAIWGHEVKEAKKEIVSAQKRIEELTMKYNLEEEEDDL